MDFDKEGLCRVEYNGVRLLERDAKGVNTGGGLFCENVRYKEANGVVQELWDGPSSVDHVISAKTTTLKYRWGSVSARYRVITDTLFIDLTVKNEGKGTLLGVSAYPLRLRFPERPKGFIENYAYFNFSSDAPPLTIADYGVGKIAYCNDDVSSTSFNGLLADNVPGAFQYKCWISNIPFNGMPQKISTRGDSLALGAVMTYRLSIRFGGSAVKDADLAKAVVSKYASQWPAAINWPDRRPIGYMVLSSVENKGRGKLNKRGWLPGIDIDVTTVQGKRSFAEKVLEKARTSLPILKGMDAQGVITWDIEGQEFQHPISYIGTPELLPILAPEMNEVADAYFKVYRDAGYKTGICIRPDSVYLNTKTGEVVRTLPKGDATTVGDYVRYLSNRISYARSRWGCSIYYVDSNIEGGIPMNPEVFRMLAKRFPDVLIIPEHETARYYAYSSPLIQLRADGYPDLQMPKAMYPGSFSVVSVAEGMRSADGKLKYSADALAALIRDNVLLFRAWYDDPENKLAMDLRSGKSLK